MNQQPNAIEAISEALRRLHLNIKSDIAAGRWEAIQREAEQDKQAQDEAYNALRCAGQPR